MLTNSTHTTAYLIVCTHVSIIRLPVCVQMCFRPHPRLLFMSKAPILMNLILFKYTAIIHNLSGIIFSLLIMKSDTGFVFFLQRGQIKSLELLSYHKTSARSPAKRKTGACFKSQAL